MTSPLQTPPGPPDAAPVTGTRRAAFRLQVGPACSPQVPGVSPGTEPSGAASPQGPTEPLSLNYFDELSWTRGVPVKCFLPVEKCTFKRPQVKILHRAPLLFRVKTGGLGPFCAWRKAAAGAGSGERCAHRRPALRLPVGAGAGAARFYWPGI